MKRSLLAIAVSLLGLLIVTGVVGAEGDAPLSAEALSIANALNCPVCTGESVRDSSSQIAHDMRELIQEKLDQGQTRQQIMDYFVSRYGETILREPPKSGISLTLWWLPVVALVAGVLILIGFVTQRRRMPADGVVDSIPANDPDLDRYADLVERDIDAMDASFSQPQDPGSSDTGADPRRIDDRPAHGLAGSDQGVS